MALRSFADGTLFGHGFGGGRPAVLALHGWARTGADFAASLGSIDALALDLPGFGASPAPPERMGAAGYARLVAPVLDACGPGVVVVGHSFGGRVAVALAEAEPERVRALVLTGVPLVRIRPPGRPPWSFRAARIGNRLGLVPDEQMESLRRRRGSADYRAATGVMREVLVTVVNESYERELAGLTVPVRMVWGSDDRETPPVVAERAREILEAAGVPVVLDVVPGAGHLLPLEHPDAIRRAVEAVLA
jgi:pimeloyl-ACP methyl ester carboxylesterase